MLKLKKSAISNVSHLNEYLEKKKKEEDEEKKKKQKQQTSGGLSLKSSAVEDIAPVVSSKTEDSSWFKKSNYFADGSWDKWDLTKTILGTVADAGEDLLKGGIGGMEKALDYALALGNAMNTVNIGQANLNLMSSPYAFTKKGKEIAPGLVATNNALLKEAEKTTVKYIDKDLIKEEDIAKAIISAPIKEHTGMDIESASVTGKKLDATVESIGNSLVSKLIGTVFGGGAGTAYVGLTAAGGAIEEALKEGAKYEGAVANGIITAAAEMAGGLFFNGVQIGGHTLTEGAVRKLASAVSGSTLQTLAKWGINTVGEGAEEVISDLMSSIGKKLTYMHEKEFNEIFSVRDAWDSFIGGMVAGGLFEGVDVAANKIKGTNYVTGLTKTEQKVFEKEVENRIAEEEKDGKKLSNGEKTKIREKVMQDIDKGYISTDTIESVLGGDEYESYKKVVEARNKYESLTNKETSMLQEEYKNLQEEYNELNKLDLTKAKLGDHNRQTEIKDRMAEIEAKIEKNNLSLEEFKKDSILSDKKKSISKNVFDIVKDSRLAESYYEADRQNYKFQADVSKYKNEYARKTVQSAIDSGLLNNTNKTHEFVDMVAKISADKGMSFDFVDNKKIQETGFAVEGRTVNGYKTDEGNIAVNIKAKKALNVVVGHEITHILEGTEFYSELQQVVENYAKAKGEYVTRYQALAELYEGVYDSETFDKKIKEELTADMVGEYLFTDANFVNKLSTEKPHLFKWLYDEIKYLCKVATAGSEEARELEKVKKAFEKAYRESAKSADTKLSLSSDDYGHKLTKEQQEFFKDTKTTDHEGNLKVLYHGSRNPLFTEFNTEQGVWLTDDSRYAEVYADMWHSWRDDIGDAPLEDRHLTGNENEVYADEDYRLYKMYANISNPLNLGEIDVEITNKEISKLAKMVSVSKADIQRIVDSYYCGMVFDITRTGEFMEMARNKGYDGFSATESGRNTWCAFDAPNQVKLTTNGNPTSNPDIRYSLSAETESKYNEAVKSGDTETAQRIVDEVAKENGYTEKLYHGTLDFGFTKLDVAKGDDGISFFATDSLDVARTYSDEENTRRIYDAARQTDDDRYEIVDDMTSESYDFASYCNRTLGIQGWVDYNYFEKKIDELVDDLEHGVKQSDVKDEFIGFCDEMFFTFVDNYYNDYHYEDGISWESFQESDEYEKLSDEFYEYVGKIVNKFDLLNYDSDAGNYQLYANTEGLLEIDAEGKRWNQIPFDKYDNAGLHPVVNTRQLARYAKHEGYKGVKITNVFDDGGRSSNYQRKPASVYIFFEPQSQLKSADAITYDDNGNVIPLSERFNEGKNDIRYSLSADSEGNKLTEGQRYSHTEEETQETNARLNNIGYNYDATSETVSYSLSSLEESFDYKTDENGMLVNENDYLKARNEYVDALAKSIAAEKGKPTREEYKKADRYLDSLFLIHDMIAEDRDRLDYEAAVDRKAWVSNVEYGGSIDFSTLCAKRRLFTGTFDAIQNALPDTVLTDKDFLNIRKLLLEHGEEAPCSMCYVEGSRAKHGVYVDRWLKEYLKTNPKWKPQIADFTSTTRLEQTRIQHPEAYKKYVEAMNKLAQRKPKEASVRTDYKGEILDAFSDGSSVEEKNINGGIRFNSFSDFEIIHALDCMQVLMDMSRVGLNGQAYTKVKEFAEAFGNTGLKINLSLVAKDVDANGKLVMDETNGMNYAEAMDIRKRYSDNVGTVIVVFNDAQLKAALADSTIDFVLPFHRSQWRKAQYALMGLPDVTRDYTNIQNDRYKNPKTGRAKKVPDGNIMPNEYWDFTKSGRENAQRYLDYINENSYIPKFDFVLNRVDGKWVLPEGDIGDGYFKLLIDFKMYNNEGVGSPQRPVLPEFNMPYIQQMLNNYVGGHQAFPVAHDVVNEFVEGKKNGKYSLSDPNETPKRKYGEIYGEDVRYQPTEDVAPVKTTVSKSEQVDEGFVDGVDYAPMTEEHEDSQLLEDGVMPLNDITVKEYAPAKEAASKPIETVRDRNNAKLENYKTELTNNYEMRKEAANAYNQQIAKLQAEYEGKKNKQTGVANSILQRIERLKRIRDNTDAQYEKRINDIRSKIDKMNTKEFKTAEQRATKQQEYTAQMEHLIGDTSTWKDKKLGISYEVNTLRRNLRDVIRDENGNRDIARADAIYEELQGKYNHNEAELNREANRIKKQFADMKLSKAEDTYIQMLGEFRYNPDTTLTEEAVKDFYEKHKRNIDDAKVEEVLKKARPLYDDLLVRVNKVLSEQGMKEIPYRKGYFPHFKDDKQGILGKIFNWKTKDNEIPTSIAGLSEMFEPVRSYQSFDKQRKGDDTDYSFSKGLDAYVRGALDWIYHIEDIQKRRAFENHIRYTYSEEGIKAKIEAIHNNEEYDADEAQEQIELVYAKARNPLNNFIQDFHTATNTLAGKKSSLDRATEQRFNRKVYSVMTNLSNRVTGNMVAGSVSSALTNFIPITQSWVEVSPVSSLVAMRDTIKSTIRDDGTIDKSDFLTNRLKKAENLYKTNWDKASEALGWLMESIDSFTSQTVWRSKYRENLSSGMSESEAIKNADQFAANILADRSRGNQPTLFDSKSPLAKIFTAFQLEVNNQYGYMFKDAPQDIKNKSKARLIKGYATAFLGAYAYNALYSTLTGRDAALDPIGIIEDLMRDLGFGGDDEEEKEIAPVDVALNFTNNILKEVPFIGGLLGGGRIHLSSALPYGGIKEAYEGTLQDLSEGNKVALTKEWLNPIYYLAMPMGGGQIRKTQQGLGMFNVDAPIAPYYGKGNIDLNSRPVVENEDGTISTVRSMSFNEDGKEILIPTVVNGKIVSDEEAIEHYHKTGEYLGKFDSVEEAEAYAEQLHKDQEKLYSSKKHKKPVAGSYTDSGNLRFPVDDTLKNRIQAGIFGQYANKNARTYFDEGYAPLKEKQIQEYKDVEMPIEDYWKYRDGLKNLKKQDEKVAYINGLDISEKQKNVLKSYLYDEKGYAEENPEKYAFLEREGIGFLGYKELDEDTQNSWSWAFKNQDKYEHLKENGVYPEEYSTYYIPMLEFEDEDNEAYMWEFDNPEKASLGKVFDSGVKEYRQYSADLYEIKGDPDGKGGTVYGSSKRNKTAYIWSLPIDEGQKMILYRSLYDSKSDKSKYNRKIVEYLNSRDDISYDDMKTILTELDFTVDEEGNIYW